MTTAPDRQLIEQRPEPESEQPRPTLARVSGLGFRYPAAPRPVLDEVAFKVEAGRSIGIVGPSGCGKSTLLALLAGLLRPTGGAIEWAPVSPGRHPISMVFQKDTLLPWRTVTDNVLLSSHLKEGRRARGRAGEKPKVEDLLALAGLTEAASLYPHQLSGGMRRRVAFLSAVAPLPRTLLLDEPFSSVDEPTRVDIHQDVFDIAHKYDMTMILVTHDLAEALSLCDEVLILSTRPGTVVSSHPVPFGRQRKMLELRQTPEFLEMYGLLWRDLSQQIAIGKTRTGNGNAL
ncbi:MAG: sulfonate transport system ATP-binding protein [Acidimicrobiia bacterium]|jgi:NitT/TauT family transport system ATP-binding protein|nr:sulfonate transport system ATP-binding protein [Acidimicrobiia bacterium]